MAATTLPWNFTSHSSLAYSEGSVEDHSPILAADQWTTAVSYWQLDIETRVTTSINCKHIVDFLLVHPLYHLPRHDTSTTTLLLQFHSSKRQGFFQDDKYASIQVDWQMDCFLTHYCKEPTRNRLLYCKVVEDSLLVFTSTHSGTTTILLIELSSLLSTPAISKAVQLQALSFARQQSTKVVIT